MPTTAEAVVEVLALGLAVYAAVRSLPRPLDLPWRRVFDVALGALTHGEVQAEVAELGESASPGKVIGPGVDWAAVAGWTAPVQTGLARRFRDVVFADIGCGWARQMSEQVPGVRGISMAPPADASDDEALAESLLGLVPRASERIVLLLSAGESERLLRALALAPAVRDRVVAVIAIGERLRGEERPDWLDEHFDHTAFDTELNRATPWISVADSASDEATQRWPDPVVPESGRRSIDPIALGPATLAALPRAALCRALWVLLAFRLYE